MSPSVFIADRRLAVSGCRREAGYSMRRRSTEKKKKKKLAFVCLAFVLEIRNSLCLFSAGGLLVKSACSIVETGLIVHNKKESFLLC